MGLVIAPDIFGLRPLFDEMVQRLADQWSMTVCAVDPFPGRTLSDDIEPRFAAVAQLDDDSNLRDLVEAADACGHETAGLMGYCMGGMYCHKASRSDRFARIASFYGMIRLPDAWRGPNHGEPLDYLLAGHADRVLAIIGDVDPDHAFAHDSSRSTHRADDAADAYARAFDWLHSGLDPAAPIPELP